MSTERRARPKPDRLLRVLAEDLRTIVERDPSIHTLVEALWHPGLPALWAHRVAHLLHRWGLRLIARIVMTVARAVTAVEIHPGAQLGRRVFIDHGAAVVIGETAVVGDDVTIYHHVTLGAIGWWVDNRRAAGERRHPAIGAGVVLGASATVLGPVTVGDGAVIGAQALILKDVPPGAQARAPVAVIQSQQEPPLAAVKMLRQPPPQVDQATRAAVNPPPRPLAREPHPGRKKMHPETTLLLVGANEETLRKAKALGLHVLLLQHPEKFAEEQLGLADIIRIVDYTDLAALELVARELHESVGFAAATSLTEPGLEGAGQINDIFGLGGTGFAVARRMRDKWAMRRHLAGSGPATVGAAPLADRADIDRFGTRYGYPFIVKPVDGTASYGVFRVDGPEAADAVWAKVAALRGHRMDRGSMPFAIQGFLMEEYVEGPEFSVECFSFAGRHVVVAITEKFISPDHFAELGQAVPARLDAGAEDSMRRAVCGFLDAMDLRDGVSHTEVRLSGRGPVVIETHNRVGGDAIDELVRGAYGVDLVTYAVGWPFRLVPELPDVPRAHGAASTMFLVGGPGRVESISGVEEALATADVLKVQITARPGDTVRAVRDNWDRLGLVAVTAADTASAIRRGAELISDTIRIQVRGEDGVIHPARIAADGRYARVPEVPTPANRAMQVPA